jgi:hypothetical protein
MQRMPLPSLRAACARPRRRQRTRAAPTSRWAVLFVVLHVFIMWLCSQEMGTAGELYMERGCLLRGCLLAPYFFHSYPHAHACKEDEQKEAAACACARWTRRLRLLLHRMLAGGPDI